MRTYSKLILSFLAISCSKEKEEIVITQPNEITFKTGKFNAKFNHPESVIFDGTSKFYVSDIGVNLAPHIKDGDGKIIVLDKDGNVINSDFAKSTLNAPKGITISGKQLLVNDIDKVRILDLTTGVEIKNIDFSDLGIDLTAPGGTGLNDIIPTQEPSIFYVSITNNGSIYKIDTKSGTKELITTNPYANGLFLDKENLYSVAFKTGYSLKKYDIISKQNIDINNSPDAAGGLDGIAKIGNKLYISDWGAGFTGSNEVGQVFSYDINEKKSETIDLKTQLGKSKLNGPADISSFGSYLFIPAMGEGAIYCIKL